MASDVVVRPIATADGPALSAFFDASGSRCFCRWWSFVGDKNDWLARCAFDADVSRAEMEGAVGARAPDGRGIVAVEGDDVVGWLKLAPAIDTPRIYEQRYYRGLPCFAGDRDGVLVIGCVLVRPDRRHAGVATALVDGAIAEARRIEARAIEALPRITQDRVSDEELWLGPASVLVRRGFTVVGGDPAYPAMRLDLGAGAS